MKKNLLFIVASLLFAYRCDAQNVTTPTVVLHGSYIATGDFSVYPYMEKKAKYPIDSTLHFRIKKGTKFYIEGQIVSQSTTQGYVITVWDFNNNTDTLFYKRLLGAQSAKKPTLDSLNADLVQKKATIKSVETDVAKTTKKADTLKISLSVAQKSISDVKNQLVVSGLNTDTNKVVPPPTTPNNHQQVAKPEVSAFAGAQKKLKAAPNSDTLKSRFIDAILKLPAISDTSLETSRTQLKVLKKNYDGINTALNNTLADINTKKAALNTLLASYQTEQKQIIGQTNNTGAGKNDYKKTKEQSGEEEETPGDPTSPFAAYADLEYVNSWANGWKFFMNTQDFSNDAVTFYPYGNSFTWGFLTLPIKIRFGNSIKGSVFNFEQNLNFGLTAGIKHQIQNTNDISMNYLAGLSVVNVPLYNAVPTTTTTTIPATGPNTTVTTPGSTATSTAAVSLSLGGMLQYSKFQIGIFVGIDLAGDHSSQFVYQGRPWIGFAIGLSLFGEGQTTAGGKTQTSN